MMMLINDDDDDNGDDKDTNCVNVSIGNIMVLKLFFSNHFFYELLFSIINTRISSINKQFEGLQWIDADDTGCERCAVDLEGLQWTEADDAVSSWL